MRVQGEDLDWRLTLVAQKRGDTLVLIGLDAFGAKEFVLTQTRDPTSSSSGRAAACRCRRSICFAICIGRASRRRGAAPEPGVTLQRSADGAVTIEHARCGYRATWVAFEETPLAAPAGPGP